MTSSVPIGAKARFRLNGSVGLHERCGEVKEIFLATVVILGLSGCYPALRTEQPKVMLRVHDESGRPIKDATFTLATYRYPFPSPRTTKLLTQYTDAGGVVSLSKKRKWQWEILLPDGSAWYEWGFCLEKPGYRAVASADADFDDLAEVVLKESPVSSRCKWPGENEAYYEFKVVE
jgi:hypothetical protein